MKFQYCFLLWNILIHINILCSTCKKWIFITSINYPTQAIKQLSNLSEWHVLVVADKKTPTDWKCEQCTLLTLADQKKLGYAIYDYLPFNHYSRKNIGYLYAISHGAEIIYDTDDDNIPIYQNLSYLPEQYTGPLVKTKNSFCNIYNYFGNDTVWPRGFPLEEILSQTKKEKIKTTRHFPLIQQALVNNNPDVDAVFRLTRSSNINFYNTHASLSLPAQTFCPFNTQSTFFHKKAFWGLLIPVSTKFRVCDIWRGYITQRLLWEIGGSLTFLPPQAFQERNPHNLLSDFIDEQDLYIHSKRLVTQLKKTQLTNKTFEEKYLALIQCLTEQHFYDPIEIKLAKAWLDDLKKLNYKMPQFSEDK